MERRSRVQYDDEDAPTDHARMNTHPRSFARETRGQDQDRKSAAYYHEYRPENRRPNPSSYRARGRWDDGKNYKQGRDYRDAKDTRDYPRYQDERYSSRPRTEWDNERSPNRYRGDSGRNTRRYESERDRYRDRRYENPSDNRSSDYGAHDWQRNHDDRSLRRHTRESSPARRDSISREAAEETRDPALPSRSLKTQTKDANSLPNDDNDMDADQIAAMMGFQSFGSSKVRL